MAQALELSVTASGHISLACPGWDGFVLDGLLPVVTVDGEERRPSAARVAGTEIVYDFDGRVALTLTLMEERGGLHLRARLRNPVGDACVLNHVLLLDSARAAFGQTPQRVQVLCQYSYGGDVQPLAGKARAETAGNEPNTLGDRPADAAWRTSENVWVAYDRDARQTLLVGFTTNARWCGGIALSATPDGAIKRWRLGFDGGDLELAAGEEIALEEAIILTGADPLTLLDVYGDAAAAGRAPEIPELPPVSWCSWYPYRLGVTEERLLETARIGQARLGALGLRIIEADLGWEWEQLPSTFEENDQFPHGLQWLADGLARYDMALGVWKAPYTISEFDPLVREHPEWLVADADGVPFVQSTWYWVPHGDVYLLDLTHPGAQGWLRARIHSLHARGVRYLKLDFISAIGDARAKRRHDRRIVAGGGCEALRLGARIVREEMPDSLILNCGGPELPGPGQWPLLYACNDTGNAGFITWAFQRDNFRALACHLFKNRRWGWIQPSCLCVGLPATLEEARLRATAAFLSGGQIDISDTLTTLPEDRWQVLTVTLPPLGLSARPLDLFEPVVDPGCVDSPAVCTGDAVTVTGREHAPGSVWHLPLRGGWDDWHLLATFAFNSNPTAEAPHYARFALPLGRLGLHDEAYWAYEFWSGQFLGTVPAMRHNPKGYVHSGDVQDLSVGDTPGILDIAFAGPAVKLLCLRAIRPHPWVVGSSFHQSCGTELHDVRWDAVTGTLSGTLARPAGETGFLTIAGAGHSLAAEVDGHPAALLPTANGAWRLPILTTNPHTPFKIRDI